MRPRRLLIALVAAVLVAAAGSVTSFAADAKRLSALEVRHGELPGDQQNQPGPEVSQDGAGQRSQTSTKDGRGSCGD